MDEYRQMLRRVWQESYRVLVPSSRACINIANLGRKPYLPLHGYLIEDMNGLGFLIRGEIISEKAASASSSTAWAVGSPPATRLCGMYTNISWYFLKRTRPQTAEETREHDQS